MGCGQPDPDGYPRIVAMHASPPRPASRDQLLGRGLRLEYLTVGWNVVEGLVAIAAAAASGSVALLGFGIDSFVESLSGLILVWRLRAEHSGHGARDRDSDAGGDTDAGGDIGIGRERIERIEHRARRLVALSLAALAVYVAVDAGLAIVNGERPEPSPVGLALAAISIVVMWWLAGAKRAVALALGSRALAADAVQTLACLWLSVVVIAGVGLNALVGWWWADPVAALVLAALIAREAREAWEGGEDVEGDDGEEGAGG